MLFTLFTSSRWYGVEWKDSKSDFALCDYDCLTKNLQYFNCHHNVPFKMALKRKTGDGLVVHGGQELQPLPKTSEESEAKKLRVNPPRKARMAPVAETPMSEPVLPKKTRASRKKKVADPPQVGPSQPTALAAKKQRKTAEEVETSVDLEDGWLDKFLTMTTDDLARLLGEIANHGNVKTSAIKKARTSLPSFSGAKWRPFAETFGFPATFDNDLFERVSTPVYWLPAPIHEIMFEAAWCTQDVYQERQVQRREEARVRIMDPVCQQKCLLSFSILGYAQYLVRIIGLFQGRVIDKPEQAMLETEFASSGEVEHEVRISLHWDLSISSLSYPDLHGRRNSFFHRQI